MKLTPTRMLGISVALIAVVAMAPAAVAGEYHYQDTLLCSDCHSMHFSQSHNWDGTTPVSTTGAPNGDWLGPAGPNIYLLKSNTTTNLCLACHDGKTFAPDVRGANTNSYVRLGGALTTGSAPYENWKGHTLGPPAVPPGGFSVIRLGCENCHAHHGNDGYRNLGSSYAPSFVDYALGTNDTARDVFLRSWTQGNLSTNYAWDNVDYNEPVNDASAIGDTCRGCHVIFHGRAGDSNMGGATGDQWLRHPGGDADIGALPGGHSNVAVFGSKVNRVKVMSPTGDWGPQGAAWPAPPADLTPFCLTCHKAHGNQNAFGLIYLDGAGPVTEEGDAAGVAAGMKSLCKQCHVQ